MKKEANGMDWGTIILAIAMIAGELLSGDDDDGGMQGYTSLAVPP